MRKKNVFVLGSEPFNFSRLGFVRRADAYEFTGLFRFDEVQAEGHYPLRELYERATTYLDSVGVPIDAIIGYWDFPVTPLVPLLCARYETPGPSLEAVTKCEHKYWSRLEQQRAAPEVTPRFAVVDPFDDGAVNGIELAFPFWIKPVKSHSSQLGFRIRSKQDLRRAISIIRSRIDRFAEPYRFVLDRVQMPDEIERIDGRYCVVEEIIGGKQCTVEGFVHRGQAEIYALIDSIRHPNRSSFSRYQYPSRLPKRVQDLIADVSKRIILHLGYDHATFNIEYFYDPTNQSLHLLEINPRLSQSHSDMTLKVDGVPNLDKMVEVALGQRPDTTACQGRYRFGAKFFVRRFDDAFVTEVPSEERVSEIEREVPGVSVQIAAKPGRRLSDLQNQDSYSFELALLHIGAQSQPELVRKYRAASERLEFSFEEVVRKGARVASRRVKRDGEPAPAGV